MLTVTGLTKSFGKETILDDITFTVNPGERVGFTGRNGSGKTTLLKLHYRTGRGRYRHDIYAEGLQSKLSVSAHQFHRKNRA